MPGILYRVRTGEVVSVTSKPVSESWADPPPEYGVVKLSAEEASEIDLSAPLIYTDGKEIREATTEEIDGFAAGREADEKEARKRAHKEKFPRHLLIRAVTRVVIREINALRDVAGLDPLTRTDVVSQIRDEVDLL